MELKNVKYIKECHNAEEAQEHLAEDWKLIAIVPTTRPNGQSLPCYVLGKGYSSAEILKKSGL